MKNTPTRVPRLLSKQLVADQLGMSVKTVTRKIQSGELRSHRLGRTVRIAEDDVLDLRRGAPTLMASWVLVCPCLTSGKSCFGRTPGQKNHPFLTWSYTECPI